VSRTCRPWYRPAPPTEVSATTATTGLPWTFFLGTGPEVGELAGRTLAEGKLYYIFLRQGVPDAGTAVNPQPPANPQSDQVPEW